MNKEEILQQLKDNGMPLQITDKIKLYEVCNSVRGVIFDFIFYGSDARVQLDFEDEKFPFVFAEVQDGVLMSSFEEFHEDEETIELLKEVHKYLEEN